MATQYTEEFKKDAVRYWKEHPDLGINKCAKNLGISKSALSTWKNLYDKNLGEVPTRGRGNFESDEAKEIARLRRELRDTQDALEILKKPSAYWENDRSTFSGNCTTRSTAHGRKRAPAECLRCAEKVRRLKKRVS